MEFEALAALQVRNAAERDSLLFLDWHSRSHSNGGRYFQDYAHFTDSGAGALAGNLSEVVVAWLDKATPMKRVSAPPNSERQ